MSHVSRFLVEGFSFFDVQGRKEMQKHVLLYGRGALLILMPITPSTISQQELSLLQTSIETVRHPPQLKQTHHARLHASLHQLHRYNVVDIVG